MNKFKLLIDKREVFDFINVFAGGLCTYTHTPSLMHINKLCFDSFNTTKTDLALSLCVTPPRAADVPCMVPEALFKSPSLHATSQAWGIRPGPTPDCSIHLDLGC